MLWTIHANAAMVVLPCQQSRCMYCLGSDHKSWATESSKYTSYVGLLFQLLDS